MRVWVVFIIIFTAMIFTGCNKECDITCVTSTNTSENLSFSYETIEIDESDDDEGRRQCEDEAESRCVGTTRACWGYYD